MLYYDIHDDRARTIGDIRRDLESLGEDAEYATQIEKIIGHCGTGNLTTLKGNTVSWRSTEHGQLQVVITGNTLEGEEKIDIDAARASFETYIGSEPRSLPTDRYGRRGSSWPGQYVDYPVQLAWESWVESAKDSMKRRSFPRA
jgi:hypothetical protein